MENPLVTTIAPLTRNGMLNMSFFGNQKIGKHMWFANNDGKRIRILGMIISYFWRHVLGAMLKFKFGSGVPTQRFTDLIQFNSICCLLLFFSMLFLCFYELGLLLLLLCKLRISPWARLKAFSFHLLVPHCSHNPKPFVVEIERDRSQRKTERTEVTVRTEGHNWICS